MIFQVIDFPADGCVDYDPAEPGWTTLPLVDDQIIPAVALGFDFTFGPGAAKTAVDISSNGHLHFTGSGGYNFGGDFIADPDFNIAPYWGDVDNRLTGSIHYKQVAADKFAVVWIEVGHFGDTPDLEENTFSVVLSADASGRPAICFCYCKMEWVDGTAASNGAGEAGISMGVGKGFLLGSFDSVAGPWLGIGTSGNGVATLKGKSFCFDPDVVDTGMVTSSFRPGGCGDPHFKTWQNEHYQYHGQCDLVLVKDATFADGLGLDIHIRTKLVRHWSYIKTAVIRIGNDILEIEGSGKRFDKEVHFWMNYEYQGNLTEFAGFPVTIKADGSKLHKNRIEIDLSSKYPGEKIVLSTFKEFVKVDFANPSVNAFGNTVGLLGDYTTGKTLARDGATVLDDFTDLGREWQVLPSDKKLFHKSSAPQFPELCIEPEDPRGDRVRRLDESSVTEEQAEEACAGIKDEYDHLDCIYDIIATQDVEMVGAY